MRLKKVWQTVSQSVCEYLEESSIHGLRYLAEGRNVVEKVGWTLIILISLYFAGKMISTSIEDNEKKPILTTIETTSIQNVPFPAITIGADGRANPWGFAQKTFNMMSFYGPDDEAVVADSSELRHEFFFLMQFIINEIDHALENQWKNWSLSDYKAYPESSSSAKILKYLFRNPKIKKLVPMLAASLLRNPEKSKSKTYIIEIKKYDLELDNYFFGKNHKNVFPFYTNVLSKLVERYIIEQKYYTNETQEIELCNNEDEKCIEFLKQSYRMMYITSEILFYDSGSYYNLEFGKHLTYFSKLILAQKLKWPKHSDFLIYEPLNYGEEVIRKIMARAVEEFADRNMMNISSYELVKIAHNNVDESISEKAFWLNGPVTFQPDCMSGAKSWKMDMHVAHSGIEDCFIGIEIINGRYPKPNCCRPSDLIKDQLPTVMKIMKYSIQPAVFYEPLESFLESYDNIDFLPFNNLTKFSSRRQRNLMEYNSNPRILMCQYPEGKRFYTMVPKDCQLFHTSITSDGIGYTFNNANFWDIFRKIDYTKLFSKIMRPNGYNKEPLPSHRFDENITNNQRRMYPKNIHFPIKSGHLHGLEVYLEGHQINGAEGLPISIGIHDPMQVPELMVNIRVGYKATFRITPSQTVTSQDTAHLPKEKRGCQFQHENDELSIFKVYTESSCIFECKLNIALDKCHCMPWDYPHFNNSVATCDKFGGLCFKTFMEHPDTTRQCKCLPDCIITTYSYSIDSTKNDEDLICSNMKLSEALFYGVDDDGTKNSKNEKKEYQMPPRFIRRYEQIVSGKIEKSNDAIIKAACIQRMKNIAIVNFQIENKNIIRIKRTQRVTFADTLSNIGGTLGLFSGISLISMIELLFWMYRLFRNYIKV